MTYASFGGAGSHLKSSKAIRVPTAQEKRGILEKKSVLGKTKRGGEFCQNMGKTQKFSLLKL